MTTGASEVSDSGYYHREFMKQFQEQKQQLNILQFMVHLSDVQTATTVSLRILQ